MFSLMGNCISCIKQRRGPKRTVTLAILGLDSAGKTTTTKALLGEPLETAPTVGFSKEDICIENYNINLFDLGGGKNIRGIWTDYLAELYGVIYVVDSTARERMDEIKENLKILLGNEQVKEKPLLLLANKQDLPNNMDEVDVMEGLNLEELVNQNKCPCRLEMCSAIKGTGRKMDPAIKNGMKWLCSMLDQVYDKLKERVDGDVATLEAKQQKERDERKERVRKIREERQKKEEEEKKRLGIEDEEGDDDDDDDIVGGNPFKQLSLEEAERMDEKYKKAKAKEKAKQKRLKELDEQDRQNLVTNNITTAVIGEQEEDIFRAPRSSRSLLGLTNGGFNSGGPLSPHNRHNISPRSGDEDGDAFPHLPRSSRQQLPPLQTPIGTKFMEDGGGGSGGKSGKKRNKKVKEKLSPHAGTGNYDKTKNHHHVEVEVNDQLSALSYSKIQVTAKDNSDNDVISERRDRGSDSKKLYVKERGVSERSPESGGKRKERKKPNQELDDEEGFDTLRLSQHMEDERPESHRSYLSDDRPPLPNGSSRATNGYGEEERSLTPVKKLKKKKKHLLRKNKLAPSDEEFELSDIPNSPKKQIPWVRTPSPRKMLDDEDNHQTNWGLADDLPGVDDLKPIQRTRPNLDSEDDLIL